ncbi:MAG: AtpZ/AtpI family protein [Bacteroidota bacterium]
MLPEKFLKETGNHAKSYSEFANYLGLGLQLAGAVVLFFFIGKWCDEQFGTAPWLMIIGLLLGSVGGFISFFKKISSLTLQQNKKK